MWIPFRRRKEKGGNARPALDAHAARAQMIWMDKPQSASARDPLSAAGMLLPFVAALAMVALSTIAGSFVAPRWGNGAVDLLYLPGILASAILLGFWPALVAGIASALAYNFFFTPPFNTFRMDRPADIVTVVILFLVATVTSKLAANVREQADLARRHATRNATVAGFAARLLSCSGKSEIAGVVCGELSRIFRCNVALVEGRPRPDVVASEPATVPMSPSDVATAASVLAFGEAAGRGALRPYPTDWQFHPVGPAGHVMAAVGLVRDDDSVPISDDQKQLLESLLSQVALALERARLEREARELSALRERDQLRSTLLSSIGRDLRPRVDAIAGTARELRRNGSADKAAAAAIASEAARLDRYLSNLAELGLDSDQRPLEVRGLTIDLARRLVSRDGTAIHLTPKEYAVLAELAKHPGRVLSHGHLLRTAWGPAQEGQTEYLRVAIRALRQKLERDPAKPEIIRNEPAVGYRLVA
jgi:two-component system sensor histidine kinase KdpD